jgi:hypothetical protein
MPPKKRQLEVMMKERYIPAFVMLLAGAVTSMINIINKVELVSGLKRLLLVVIIFYFVGLVVKAIIKIAYKKIPEKEETEGNKEEVTKPEETKKL